MLMCKKILRKFFKEIQLVDKKRRHQRVSNYKIKKNKYGNYAIYKITPRKKYMPFWAICGNRETLIEALEFIEEHKKRK